MSHKFQQRLHACTVIAKAKLVKPDLLDFWRVIMFKSWCTGRTAWPFEADVRGPRGRGHRGPRARGHRGPRGRGHRGPRGRGHRGPRGRGHTSIIIHVSSDTKIKISFLEIASTLA